MKLVSQLRYLVLALAMATCDPLLASAQSDFSKGSERFRAGDYTQAAQYFEAARKQGMDSVALYYNLGSSYFKLADYRQARHYFALVAKDAQMHDLAEYNLGLVALKQGDARRAETHFNQVLTVTGDDKLRVMTQDKLDELQRDNRPWTAFVSANLGYDDNITASPAGSAQGVSDRYYDVFASADWVLAGRREQGWLGEANFFTIDYNDGNMYDENVYGVGLRREQSIAGWDARATLGYSKSHYAGDPFQSIFKVDLKARRTLNKNMRLQLQYRYDDINSDNTIYDYLQGWRQKFAVDLRDYRAAYNLKYYYELELNDRQDLQLTTGEISYSPTRHTLGVKYTRRLNDDWGLATDLSYRDSDYPGTIIWNRDDSRWRFRVDADYRLQRSSKLRIRVQYLDNESTVDTYDYDKTLFSVGLSKFF